MTKTRTSRPYQLRILVAGIWTVVATYATETAAKAAAERSPRMFATDVHDRRSDRTVLRIAGASL